MVTHSRARSAVPATLAGVAFGVAATSIFFLNLSLGVTRYTLSALIILSLAGLVGLIGLSWFSVRVKQRIDAIPIESHRLILDFVLLRRKRPSELTDGEHAKLEEAITGVAGYVFSVFAIVRSFGFVFAAITVSVSAAILIATLMQVERLDQQNQLAEASRRAALINELTAILTEIDEELDGSNRSTQKMGDIDNPELGKSATFVADGFELSQRLVWRIVALSRSLRPYKFLEGDTLVSTQFSPERAQLLVSLIASGIDLKDIFRMGSFEHSYLRGAELPNVFLRDTKLAYSNFEEANLITSDLSEALAVGANFRGAILFLVKFEGADLRNADFSGSRMTDAQMLNNTKMAGANLDGAVVSNSDWLERLQKLPIPPQGLEYEQWEVSASTEEWSFGGDVAGTGYVVRRKELTKQSSRRGDPRG